MSTIKAAIGFMIVALILSLSVATAAAQYPPTNPPDNTVPTQVAGIQQTNTGADNTSNDNLAFTGRSIGTMAGLGGVLVVAGVAFWFVGQRRQSQTT